MPIPFGEWAPDAYGVNADYAGEAAGVLPRALSYGPWPQLAETSLAVPAAVRGAFAARTSGNAAAIYAFTAARGYRFAGVGAAWTNITRVAGGDYALAADEYWSIKQFGSTLLAAQGSDAVQAIDVDAGSNLTALAGSPPNARSLAVVGDFVMLGAPATSRRSVKWSGRNDAASYTAGQKDSDAQVFPHGGDVQGIVGFERGGLIFQSETIRQMAARLDAAVFEFHRVDPARGTPAPNSIVADGADVYYYATSGFSKIAGDGSVANLGIDRVNDWFGGANGDCNKSRFKAVIGALDPLVRRIFWLYPSAANATSTILDRILCYDIERNRWTHANVSASYIFTAAVPGVTLAGLAALYPSLSAVPYPFGSDVWKGGAPGLAAFDAANKLAFFSGTPMAGTVQTSPFEPVPGSRAFVRGFRLIGDAANAAGRVGTAERPETPIGWKAAQSLNPQGRIPARASGRLAQVEVTIAAGESWRDLQGIDFDEGDLSEDGRR
jgi:hypothetical protein